MKKQLTFLAFIILFANTYSQIENTKNNVSSLMNNPAISVTIGGEFPVTGSFPALLNDRVDQFITRMYLDARTKALGNITDPETLKKLNEKLNNFSLRGITLKRASGESIVIDLEKFRLNGDFNNNPYLKNDDVIIFPSANIEFNFFRISGAVNSPGKFSYSEGDKLFDAIELAQGINPAFKDVNKVEINRLSYDGQTMTKLEVNVNTNIPLQRGDRITVIADETQKKDFSVMVIGEVIRPGKIGITKSTTTLKKLIELAGGFTENASMLNSKLYTAKSVPFLLNKLYTIPDKNSEIFDITEIDKIDFLLKYQNSLMMRMSNIDEEDSAYFILENELRLLLENGPVDFTKIEDTNSKDANYIVKDGDLIIIPEKENRVYVFGQVVHPGYVDLIKGENYEYYIDNAGGTGEYARNDVMVIKGSSREWIPADKNVKIEEGDFIYVPRNIVKSFNYYVKLVGNYLSIAGSIATVILLLVQLGK